MNWRNRTRSASVGAFSMALIVTGLRGAKSGFPLTN